MSAVSLALTPHGQGPHRRVREPGAWGPAPPPYLFADSRGSSADDSWRPSLCKSGDGRCFVLRLPGVMTRRPCGAQLHGDKALFSLGARGTLARCGLAATRRQPTGAPWGPAGGHRLCARHLLPPGLRLRAVYAAQVCFWMVCILWFMHTWCYSGANGNGMLAWGSPPSAAAATLI